MLTILSVLLNWILKINKKNLKKNKNFWLQHIYFINEIEMDSMFNLSTRFFSKSRYWKRAFDVDYGRISPWSNMKILYFL